MAKDPYGTPKNVPRWFLGPLEYPRPFFEVDKNAIFFWKISFLHGVPPVENEKKSRFFSNLKNGLGFSKGPKKWVSSRECTIDTRTHGSKLEQK